MVKAREAEGTSIHKKQISNYIPTEKLPLDIKKKALDKRKKSAINDYHGKLKVTECFKRKQHFTLWKHTAILKIYSKLSKASQEPKKVQFTIPRVNLSFL